MKIYLVTKQEQELNRCGKFNEFFCYLLGFIEYRKKRPEGVIFATATQALTYMIRNEK